MVANAAELVDGGKRTDICKAANLYVAGQRSRIRHNDVIAQGAVVGNVHAGHEEVVVANFSYAAALFRAAVQRGRFPDDIPVAYHKAGYLALVADVLALQAHAGMGKNVVLSADFCVWPYDDVAPQHSPRAYFAWAVNHTERPYFNIVAYFGIRANHGHWVDFCRH
jgi:hypothetical protein